MSNESTRFPYKGYHREGITTEQHALKNENNRTAEKRTVLSYHRCLITTGVEKKKFI
jgi:hypothetical protein